MRGVLMGVGSALCCIASAVALSAGHWQGKGSIAPKAEPSRVGFTKVVINADSDFEAANAADINGDGTLDIVSGDTWYEAPNWTPHRFREIAVWGRDANNSGYRADFADLPLDVNGDGKIDIVSSDYASGEIYWHENAGNTNALWKKTVIAKPGSAETTVFAPILGKKSLCILPNCGNQVVWYELRKQGREPQWVEHKVGNEGAAHGIGWGDVNRDGKIDLLSPHGWYEQIDARTDKWTWHKDWEARPGDWCISAAVLDFDGDGLNDVLFGSGHNYGVYVLKQSMESGARRWTQQTIDDTWSQAHATLLTPLEGGREQVLLTGKRYKAHDHDPGAEEPLCLFYYRYDRKAKAWRKHTISYGGQVGTGLQLTTVDMRGTGRLDVIAPGKSGLYLFLNEGHSSK